MAIATLAEPVVIPGFDKFETKMKAAGCSQAAIDAFAQNYKQLVEGVTGLVPESEIEPVDNLPRLTELKAPVDVDISAILSQTAVLKLNGGLGTSMGLEKAKSLLEVKNGKTFLDLIADQIKYTRNKFGSNVKFMLMDSFSTSDDTKEFLSQKHLDLLEGGDWELLQNMSPKVDAKTMEPASCPGNPDLEWCPPGHGDLYPAFLGSGKLDSLVAEGIKYLFVSNSDNLGATLDLDLLVYFAQTDSPFLMEVADRTATDKKGGHLARRISDGRLMLRESAMCPDEDKDAFEDITKHKFFNTNNIWINLPQLQALLKETGGVVKLPLIKNNKTINPRDSSTPAVYQLETAMGSAIENFEGAGAIVVPRSRFAPVKTCNDLFSLRTDAYKLTEASTIELAVPTPPVVKLDDKHYKLVDKMESLVTGYPSLTETKKLEVSGPVIFASDTVFKGTVKIVNASPAPVDLAPGLYEDTTVTL